MTHTCVILLKWDAHATFDEPVTVTPWQPRKIPAASDFVQLSSSPLAVSDTPRLGCQRERESTQEVVLKI
jgi:hypothetical protein